MEAEVEVEIEVEVEAVEVVGGGAMRGGALGGAACLSRSFAAPKHCATKRMLSTGETEAEGELAVACNRSYTAQRNASHSFGV